jgi:hypothetical protein
MSVACNMISLPKDEIDPQGITVVIKAVIAIAGPVKKKSGLGIRFKFFFSKQF